jgi:hypothetical protein
LDVVMVVVMHHGVMVTHRVMMPYGGVMAHRVVAVVRAGRGCAGRHRQDERRGERQGDEFQGLSPDFWCIPNQDSGTGQA